LVVVAIEVVGVIVSWIVGELFETGEEFIRTGVESIVAGAESIGTVEELIGAVKELIGAAVESIGAVVELIKTCSLSFNIEISRSVSFKGAICSD
jgi:hypothetical protein